MTWRVHCQALSCVLVVEQWAAMALSCDLDPMRQALRKPLLDKVKESP